VEPLRIGVLGAARISELSIIGPAAATGTRLVAVAARDRGRAETFAQTHGIERVHESYADVIADPEVEAIYNPLANSLHAPWNKAAILAGKHVLTEKPFASNTTEAAQVRDLESLAGLPRLHTRTFPESWAEWEAAAGVALPAAAVNREFDHYFYMLEAAAAGLGVALSPFAFVENDLAGGRLVAPLGLVPGQAQVCALTPRGRATRAARRFRDWLVAQGAATISPPGSQQLVEPAAAKPLTLSRPAL